MANIFGDPGIHARVYESFHATINLFEKIPKLYSSWDRGSIFYFMT